MRLIRKRAKQLTLFLFSLSVFVLISSCKTTAPKENAPQQVNEQRLDINRKSELRSICSVELLNKTSTPSENENGRIKGSILDQDKQPLTDIHVLLDSTEISSITDENGHFFFDAVPPGLYTIRLKTKSNNNCEIQLLMQKGEQVEMDIVLSIYPTIQTAKPIIYVYPEDTSQVNVELSYDGKITTTYPKLPKEGWKVTAYPGGTLIDESNKKYYALYWEGKPRKPLEIKEGFVVSKERTIPFLEEKLALLGLNAREANEFIIFWLPILEENNFNLIRFAHHDYLEQAQLTVSPKPETIIRIAMVFQGLDEPIEIPIQDLTSLKKTRKGFTLVEWGGQELPKMNTREI